jgi:hypothetical protein
VPAIAALRRVRLTSARIADVLSTPLSIVSGVLMRIGLGKLSRLAPPEPPNRDERRHPGELIHIDVTKPGRIQGGAGHLVTGHKHTHVGRDRKRHVGWEYVHVCVDDASRRPTPRCSPMRVPAPRSALAPSTGVLPSARHLRCSA